MHSKISCYFFADSKMIENFTLTISRRQFLEGVWNKFELFIGKLTVHIRFIIKYNKNLKNLLETSTNQSPNHNLFLFIRFYKTYVFFFNFVKSHFGFLTFFYMYINTVYRSLLFFVVVLFLIYFCIICEMYFFL